MAASDSITLSSKSSSRRAFSGAPISLPAAWVNASRLAEFTPDVSYFGDPRAPAGDVGISAEALFDRFSVARKSPLATFYVNVGTGADGNNGLTPGTAKKTIGAAIVAANTAAVASQIIVAAGDYNRTNGFYQGGTGAPAVDIAFIASGLVTTGTWDDYATPSADATFTNTYSFALANANRVIDLTQIDRFGNYLELTPVSTPAICNRTPNSWVINAGTIYLNRADGAQPTQATTRIYRANVDNMRVTNPVNIFLGTADDNSLWDFQGGQVGCVRYNPSTKPAVNKAFVVKRANFRYGGGSTNTTGNGVAVDSVHGIAAFFKCQADANWSDGFNFKNALTPSTRGYCMTVNCGADDNGRGASQSNNGCTSHNDVTGLDVCGIYEGNRGGTYRSIDTTISWAVSPVVKDDFGDLWAGGTIQPTMFRADNSARVYVTDPNLDIKGTGFRFYAAAGAYIAVNNAIPSRFTDFAGGTIDTF